MAAEPAFRVATFEREIAERIAAAGVRLRFDKVALRLVYRLKASVADIVPDDQCIMFTVTAPVRLPAKTGAALQCMLRAVHTDELRRIVNGNEVRARRVTTVPTDMPRVIGFVHNPESNAGLILDLAESILGER
jgi:hypothetical protein